MLIPHLHTYKAWLDYGSGGHIEWLGSAAESPNHTLHRTANCACGFALEFSGFHLSVRGGRWSFGGERESV